MSIIETPAVLNFRADDVTVAAVGSGVGGRKDLLTISAISKDLGANAKIAFGGAKIGVFAGTETQENSKADLNYSVLTHTQLPDYLPFEQPFAAGTSSDFQVLSANLTSSAKHSLGAGYDWNIGAVTFTPPSFTALGRKYPLVRQKLSSAPK
ncbi:MAG: hypothetical protein IPM60_09395 [Rhodospirillales bacterium]|nr:hypothetical protein [Rhodospirillales bacterium]